MFVNGSGMSWNLGWSIYGRSFINLLILFRSINKHGRHRQFLFLIGRFLKIFSSETARRFFRNQPIRNKNGLWRPCLLTDRDEMSNLYRWPSINDSYQLSVHLVKRFQNFYKFSSLKLLSQMNRNLAGSTYGRFCIKIPQSRMKGERHRLSPLSL
jgi:hypothetical protein